MVWDLNMSAKSAGRRLMRHVSGRVSRMAVLTVGLATAGAAHAQSPVLTINNEFLTDTRLTSTLLVAGPPEVAREMALITSAMFDAANVVSNLPYAPVAFSGSAAPGTSLDAAVLSAGYTALRAVFANSIWAASPGGNAALQTSILARIDNTYNTALTSISGSPSSISAGVSLGVSAANANLTARGYVPGNNGALAQDGSATAILNGINMSYTAPASPVPGDYIPPNQSPQGGRIAMFPEWGSVTPAALTPGQMASVKASAPGIPTVTNPGSGYADGLLMAQCLGGSAPQGAIASVCHNAGFDARTSEQTRAAFFWNDPGSTNQPPGHWLDITDTLIQQQGMSVLDAARTSSLVSQAITDAGIAAWGVKYRDTVWRPVTAINDCSGWNSAFTTCDPTWTSLIATPPHPDYVAGHPAFSGAAQGVLTAIFGTNVGFSSTSDTYCNGGGSASLRSATTSLIAACTVQGSSQFAMGKVPNGADGQRTFFGSAADCGSVGGVLAISGGDPVSCTLGGFPFYFPTVAGCSAAGGTTNPVGPGITECTLNGQTYTFNTGDVLYGTGCNSAVNGGANDSPLICPITETFATIADASSGPNGSTLSRVYGGIHTPFAVFDAQSIGNQIGVIIATEANLPEPGMFDLLTVMMGGLMWMRRTGGVSIAHGRGEV